MSDMEYTAAQPTVGERDELQQRIRDLEQRNERLRELFRNQVRQTQCTYQEVFDRVRETIEHTCGGLPDGCGWGHPIEQIVGMMLSHYMLKAQRAGDLEQALGEAVEAMQSAVSWAERPPGLHVLFSPGPQIEAALSRCRELLEATK